MKTEHENDQDALEELLQFAGRREVVEPHRSQRVEGKVFDHWQGLMHRQRRAQRRRNTIKFGGLLALAASLVLMFNMVLRVPESPAIATVVAVIGSAEVGFRDQPMMVMAAGAVLRAGSLIATSDNAGASLMLTSGHSLRVAAASRIRIQTDTIMLDEGSVYIDSGRTGAKSQLVVRTSFGTASEFGTQYLVSIAADSFELSVREGVVNVERNNGLTLTAKAGEALHLDRDGRARREAILSYGDRWQWAATLGQPMQLEGRTLADFFTWLSRENGWVFTYANGSLQKTASSVKLHGSIVGLDAEQALASVVATVGWGFSLSNGVVAVSSPAAND
jgi:ferric-dicitrate binding protein FerR (iron transport regulator)